ncbi:MAG TPA: SH3 domain-containing protein, partial [Aggregatilineales bacterium]|nr:SH3 domain-containing protein [Aggregatilineales bacterium]
MIIGIVKDLLNLRYGPSIDNPIVGTISPGVQIEILGPAGDYLWVKTPDGKVGYVAAAYVDVPGAVPVTPLTSTLTLTPNNGSVNLRSAPTISTTPDNRIAVIPANGQITPLEDDSSVEAKVGSRQADNLWLKVRGPDGSEGFVAAWLVAYAPGSGPSTVPANTTSPASTPLPAQPSQPTAPTTPTTPGPVATTGPAVASGASLQPDLHAFIDGLTDEFSVPQGY